MADPREHLESVPFEALAAPPTVPVAASRELAREALEAHRHARGETLQDGHEALPVRFPGGEQAQHPLIIEMKRGRPLNGAALAAGDRSPRGRTAGVLRAGSYLDEVAQREKD